MADNKKEFDWFASLVKNPDLIISDFKKIGITPETADFKSRSEYENLPQVKEMFSKPDGNFDKEAFNKFYDNALLLYNNYANDEYVPKATELFGYLDTQWDRPEGSKVMDTTPKFTIDNTAQVQSIGIDYINKYGVGPFAKQSAREIGQQQNVVDFETGQTLDWTPDDKTGLVDALFRPTLVLASYDKDEIGENGELLHRRGDLKYNENGLPYYETLGNRSISGKQVLTYSDSITREGSWLNKYDFFDSDGLDKNFVGTLAKTVFTTMPYLIPGVGEVLGAATAIIALNRVLPVLGKAIDGVATGKGEDKFEEKMNKWEAAFARFDPSVSDHSQENLVSFENLGSLIHSISGQLFQQRVVGSIPMLLNKSGNLAKQAEWGRALSYGYMSLTSAQDSFNTFKEAGASDMVAGWGFIANAIALGALMKTDYGKGLLFKGSWLDENVLKAPAKEAADLVRSELTKGIESAPAKEKAKFIQKLIGIYNKHFSSAAADTFVNRGMSEALEEVMEEGVIDVQKALTSVAQAIGINVGDEKLDFGWSLSDIAQRYGMAAAGGFLGGGIFHLQGKWDKFLANDMVQHTDEDTLQKLTYYIAQGRGQEIRDFYKQWHDKGLLGSTSLGTNLTTISSINGSELVSEPSGTNLSQNDVVYQTMINYINSIEDTISKEGLLIDTGSLVRNALNGYRETNKSLRGDTLINLGVHDLLIRDVYDVASKIVAKNAEIQSEIGKLTVKSDSPDAKAQTEENIRNSERLKSLQDDLNKLREHRDLILSGENNQEYVAKAIFASNTELAKNFIDLSIERFAQVTLGRDYKSLTDKEKEDLKAKHEEYMKNEGKNKVLRAYGLYTSLSMKEAQRLLQENETLKGHVVNEDRRVGTKFQESFLRKIDEWQRLSREYGSLVAKENKTEEELSKLQELKQQLEAVQKSINNESENPYSMLIHASKDNIDIVNLLSKGLLTSDESGQAYALIKQMYQKYSDGQEQLNNDYEYESLLRNTASDFLRAANMETRVDKWLSDLEFRESNEGEDLGSWSSWLDENGLYEDLYDEENEETNYNSSFLLNIKSLANTFIQNLGVNNQSAINALNQIKSILQERGFSSEDINALINNITPQYVEDGQILPVTDFINYIDNLRRGIKYSSFANLLQDFTTDILGERSSLIDLIENEKLKLANSPNLQDYFIRNPEILQELNEALDLIKVVRGVIKGAVDKTNSSINSAKHGDVGLILPELDENVARILHRQSYDLENEIHTLIGISKLNNQRTLKVHEEIDKHMRGKFIYSLVNNKTFVENFGKSFYTTDVSGKQTPINIEKIANDLLQGRIDLSKTETANPGDLLNFEVNFETELYRQVANSTIGNDNKAMAKALVSLFKDAWNLDTTVMNTDTETITPYSLLSYLQTVISVPAESFYTRYETVTQAEDSKFAPIYNQEMALRNVVAEIANTELSNEILNELKNTVDKSKIDPKETKTLDWLSNLSTLQNFVIIPGGAGCGKTTAIATNVSKMFEDFDHEYICLAPEKEQAENLANAVGQNIRHTDKATFFKSVFKVDLQNYRFNEQTGHIELAEIPVVNNNLFDKSKKLKLLFIDEVSLFTESELKLISKYAVQNGIIVVGLGDPIQNSGKVYTDKYLTKSGESKTYPEKAWESTGLEDCIYFGSSYLTASLRPSNLAKFENFNRLNGILNNVMQEWKQQRWLKFNELDAFIPQTIDLRFFEDDNIFYGDKVVDDDTDLVQLAKTYAERGAVTIITDDLNKYQDVPKNINVKAYNKMQGMETDFVLVDVDFVKNNKFSGGTNKYSTLRDLYTITQRSRVGTILKKNGLNDALPGLTWTKSPEVGQKVIMSEQDISVFKQKRGEILATLNKSDDLFDYIKVLTPIVTSTQAVVSQTNISTTPQQSVQTTPVNNTTTPPPSSNELITPVNTQPDNLGSNGVASNPTGNLPAPQNDSNVPQIPPPVQPVSYQQSAQSFGKKPNTMLYNSQFNSFVFGDGFKEVERQSQNSLYNWKNRHGGDKITIPDKTYRSIILALSSGIKTKLPVNLDFLQQIIDSKHNNGIDVSDFVSDLKRIFSQTPEIYVLPYTKDFRIITASYKTDSDFIQIPIALTKSAITGRYIGEFNRIKNISKKEGNDLWRPLSEFESQHPEISISPEWGVTAVEYNPKEHNLGKVSIVMTDEAAYKQYFDDWYVPDGEYYISHYKDLQHMCIQKPVNPQSILKFITSLKYYDPTGEHVSKKTIDILQSRGLWENPQDFIGYLTGNDVTNLPTDGQYYWVLDGRSWQILPADRALTFMKVGLEALYQTPDFNNMIMNMTAFMHFLFRPNQTLNDEIHAMILSDGESSYIVKPVIQNGRLIKFRATPYVNEQYIEDDDDIFFDVKSKFPFVSICKQLFGKPTAGVEFVRLINPINTNDYSIKKMSPNDNLLMLFGTQKYNMEELNNRMLRSQEFINGVYVNDSAGDFLDNAGAFRRFTGNKEGYWIKGDIWNTVWAIDVSKIQPTDTNTPVLEDNNKSEFTKEFDQILKVLPEEYKSKWKEWYNDGLAQLNAGQTPKQSIDWLIGRMNKKMSYTYNNWTGTRLVNDGNGYSIEFYDNFTSWINARIVSLAKSEGRNIAQGSTVEVEVNKLDNNYAIVAIVAPDGSKTHGSLVKDFNGTYKYFEMSEQEGMNTYESYMRIQEHMNTLGSALDPIKPYLNSLLLKYTANDKIDSVFVSQWLLKNKATLGKFIDDLNDYLEKRILANEC